jgi:oligopeptidase B
MPVSQQPEPIEQGGLFMLWHIFAADRNGKVLVYDDGKLMKKMNTFTDFIDCGNFLIKRNSLQRSHLYAQGRVLVGC